MLKINIIFLLLLSIGSLCACDMFALLLKEGNSFSDCTDEVTAFFDFLTTRSSLSTNDDGYGIIAYREGNLRLTSDDYWYKTGNGSWYGDGNEEPLDDALTAILDADNHYFMVIGHARAASGAIGSHPFAIEGDNATFTMCHNGVINSSLRIAMMEYLGENWFEEYPSNWSGEYGYASSFIDSELYFHYLAKEIMLAGNDVMSGVENALEETNLLGENLAGSILQAHCSANFFFADGENLYAFRNTNPALTSYKLSWEETNEMFGVKTQTDLTNPLAQNELICFQRDGITNSLILETDANNDFMPAAEFYAHPNPFYQEVDLVYFNSRADDNANDEINDQNLVKIYNVKGQYMRSLVSDSNDDGIRFFHWDGYNFKGNRVAAGVYFFRHQNSGILTKAVILK